MRKRLFGVFFVGILALALNVSLVAASQVAVGTEGMVASAHELASKAGAEILAAGGNAVDAAVAMGFAITVVEPNASSLGGEGYMVISLADGRDVSIDFRSWSQGHVTLDTVAEFPGVTSTLIPGLVAGLALAHEEFGVLPFADVVAPAIELARDGFPIDGTLYNQLTNLYGWMADCPVIGPVYFPDGLLPAVGSTLVQEDLAYALTLIAEQGPKVFYRGEIADAIVETTGGWVRHQDLQRYAAIIREPVVSEYRGYTVVGAPPIVAGVKIAQALNMLELYDMAGFDGWADPMAVHIMSQAMLLADQDRLAYVTDPDFFDVPVAGLISKEYATERAQLIDLEQAISPPWSAPVGDPEAYMSTTEQVGQLDPVESASTTQVSVFDADGNAVSLTQTISAFWGSRVMIDGYGFIMSNHLTQLSSDPDSLSALAPYRRTRTVIAPTVLRYPDGNVYMVIGTPGAGRIPSTIICTIVNVIDFGMSLEDAIIAPKICSRPGYLELRMEGGYPEETIQALEDLGHSIRVHGELDLFFGGVNAIIVDEDGVITGVGSFRRDGAAMTP